MLNGQLRAWGTSALLFVNRATHGSLRAAEAGKPLVGTSDPADSFGKANSFPYGLWFHCLVARDGDPPFTHVEDEDGNIYPLGLPGD